MTITHDMEQEDFSWVEHRTWIEDDDATELKKKITIHTEELKSKKLPKNLIEEKENFKFKGETISVDNEGKMTIEEKGQKFSSNKLQMSKLFVQFPKALQAVILASTYGHNKYKETDKDWLNFKKVIGGSNEYENASVRHIIDKEIEGVFDSESGLPHIFHEAWNKLAECEMWIEENNFDIKEFSKKYLESINN